MAHRMIVQTQTTDRKGRPLSNTEIVRHIPADQVEARRAAARLSAPRGSTRMIKVFDEA